MIARILVVEDNEDNTTLVAHLLRAHGVAPLLATTGEAGLALALGQPPDLILLDIRLPGMDGYEVAAAVRTHRELDATKIVAVTATAMAGDRERIAEAGFDGYIQKPIDPLRFMGEIKRFLPGAPAGRRAEA